jgi:hypothetical protein
MSDYHIQAEFLIHRGYVTGLTVDQLAEKIAQKADKPVPDGAHTRESVYDKESHETIQRIRDGASEGQKRLIEPGERTSAAIQTYRAPLNQEV